jgi:hypothetical protein
MDEQLVISARECDVVRRLQAFTEWVGAGRKLTQTDRIRMVDARTLVELLDTRDEIDPRIGTRTFKTTSSQELTGLNVVLEWALAARLVRRVHGRLVAVKKAQPLLDDPLQLWERALEALPALRVAICPPGWIESVLSLQFRPVVTALLTRLYGGPLTLDEICALSWELAAAPYRIEDAPADRQQMWRRLNDNETRRVLTVLAMLGAVRAGDVMELTPLGLWGVRRLLGEAGPGESAYQITVAVMDVLDPPVWRRLQVSAGIRLDRLHSIIQAAMGWEDYHLHHFTVDDVRYGEPDPDWELDFLDERGTVLADLVSGEGTRIGYTYDFGDNWEHSMVVERVLVAGEADRFPRCLAGEGACPPEDCGGIGGYERLREILADPSDPEHESMLDWVGVTTPADFDPARFDVERANEALARVR